MSTTAATERTPTAFSPPSTTSTRPLAATSAPSSPAVTRLWPTTRLLPIPSGPSTRSTLAKLRVLLSPSAGIPRTCTTTETPGISTLSPLRSNSTTPCTSGSSRAPSRSHPPPSPSSRISTLPRLWALMHRARRLTPPFTTPSRLTPTAT